MSTVIWDINPELANEAANHFDIDDLNKVFPPEGYQLMHTELFLEGSFTLRTPKIPEDSLTSECRSEPPAAANPVSPVTWRSMRRNATGMIFSLYIPHDRK